MGCNSDYLEATTRERELSRVACLLDELKGQSINKSHWNGYHPSVYNKPINGDALVAELCEKLQSVEVTQYSLEMQVWWRDHQEADKRRLASEMESAKTEQEKQAALAKLTSHERKLLGF